MAEMERGLEELTAEECATLLAANHVGRMAFEADDLLHLVPFNYVIDDEGRVVVRTATTSHFYRAALGRVAFEIDGVDKRRGTGWSVCVHGSAWPVADGDPETASVRALPLQPWAPDQRLAWFVVHPLAITGRRLVWQEVRPRRPIRGNRMS